MTGLAYFEWSAPADADPDDPETLRMSNPAMAVGRITDEFTMVERAAMTHDEFLRERLGIFPDKDDTPQWLVIPEAAWTATNRPPETGWLEAPRFAIEVAVDFSEASIVAAGKCVDPDGNEAEGVELVDHREGVGWLVARVAELTDAVAIDKGSTADLKFTDELLAAGVDVLLAETPDVVLAEADLILGVGAKRVFHLGADDQKPLDLSVASLVLRPYSDVTVFDRRVGAVVGPVIAASLALWASRQPVEEDDEFLF
jgi:hypothetical protein